MRSPLHVLPDLLDRVRTSLWFVPGLLMAGAFALAAGVVWIDRNHGDFLVEHLPGIEPGDPQSAQVILSTLAGSLITLTGLVFSITVVALTLASSQFGPRLLRGFMRDRITQASLGTFVATFLYCLLLLYSIGRREGARFVPNLGVEIALVLAIVSVLVLVYFIHHVSTSIHVSTVLASVSRELETQLDTMFPEELGEPRGGEARDRDEVPDPRQEAAAVRARLASAPQAGVRSGTSGYVRYVDEDRLMELAVERDLVLDLLATPGSFVVEGELLLEVLGRPELDEDTASDLRACFTLGDQRTPVQDPLFPIHQLVDLALRALSPGVNDPRTAVGSVHRLGQGLARLVERQLPADVRADADGRARVLVRTASYPSLVDASFDDVLRAAEDEPMVRQAVRDTLLQVARIATDPARRRCLEERARAIDV